MKFGSAARAAISIATGSRQEPARPRQQMRGALLVAIGAIAAAGCVSDVQRAQIRGATGPLVQATTAADGAETFHNMSGEDHMATCEVLGKFRHFAALDKCLDSLKLRRNDPGFRARMQLHHWTPEYIDGFVSRIRAERALDLGDYAGAVDAARTVAAVGDGRGVMVRAGEFMNVMAVVISYGIEPQFNSPDNDIQVQFRQQLAAEGHGIAATALALAGDAEAAARHRTALEALYVRMPKTRYDVGALLARRWIAQSHFVEGSFAQAHDWMTRDDRSFGERLYDAWASSVGAVFMPLSEAMMVTLTGGTIDDYMHLSTLPATHMTCRSALEIGRTEEARACFDAMLADNRTEAYGDLHFGALYGRGRVARLEGEHARARALYEQAIALLERQRASIVTDGQKLGFVADKLDVYGEIVDLLLEDGETERAFEYAERAKARALVDMLAGRDRFPGRSGTVGADIDAALAQLRSDALDARQVAAFAGDRTERRRQTETALETLRTADREVASLVSVEPVPLETIRGRLADDEVLLVYYGSGDLLVGFAVSRETAVARRLDAERLVPEVGALRRALRNGKPYRERAQDLYARLLAPFAKEIQGRTLTVVPHGPLHYLPFAALHDGRTHLLQRNAIRLLPSASVLQFLDRPAPAEGKLLVFGNPTLDLPGAEAEARQIREIWGEDARKLLRSEATETLLKEAGAGFTHLHLASHGTFDPDRPLDSGLLLAEDAQNDGRLTVDEIYDLALSADLITLSACDTGLGDITRGDDVIGLNRGFLFAGARSIVSSLWPVVDESTAVLMDRFYRHLRTRPKAQALQLAQLETARELPHPMHWAAFQLVGSAD